VPDPVFSESGAHWYATAPWHVDRIKANASDYDRPYVGKLEQTVDAPTWPTLAAKVAQQVRIFEEFVEGVSL
jgi:hypothetical protein